MENWRILFHREAFASITFGIERLRHLSIVNDSDAQKIRDALSGRK